MTSSSDAPGPRGPADFERVLAGSETSVAVFEEEARTPLKALQHFLHEHPTAVPFIVLVLSVLVFSALVGVRFFAPPFARMQAALCRGRSEARRRLDKDYGCKWNR